MAYLDHERLRVYQVALDFLTHVDALIAAIPRGRAHLVDQLNRAATSVCLNIAEGAGEFSAADKARFYRMAKRSATECAAVLDICARLGIAPLDELATGRALLIEVVAMLTTMAQRRSASSRVED